MIDRMAEIGGNRVPSGRDAVRLVRTDAHRDDDKSGVSPPRLPAVEPSSG